MGWRSETFRPVRRKALARWLKETRRSRLRRADDDFSGSYECRWQERACNRAGSADDMNGHCALFCGIGEFAAHVTDLLSDESQDNLRFHDDAHKRRLSRHYFRLMFIVAELLNDFENSLSEVNCGDLRKKLGVEDGVINIQIFENKVVKHKAKAIHRHDHHLPIGFVDAGDSACTRAITLGTRDFSGKKQFDCILVPSLSQLLDVILTAYQKFDELIADEAIFQQVSAKYCQ